MRTIKAIVFVLGSLGYFDPAKAVEQGEALANNNLVINQRPADSFSFRGVSVAGAAVANPDGQIDIRVSQEPIADPKPKGPPPAPPKDDGNKLASEAESTLISALLSKLQEWTRARNKADRDNAAAQSKQLYDLVAPGPRGFKEVSKEIRQLREVPEPGNPEEYYDLPILAQTAALKTDAPGPKQFASSKATQQKISAPSAPSAPPHVELSTRVSATIDTGGARFNPLPTAVGVAKNRDPYGVEWTSLAREMTIDLGGLELVALGTQSDTSALAFARSSLTLLDGSSSPDAVSEIIGPENPFARRLFSFDLWIASILGAPTAIQEFSLKFDSSVAVSDSLGNVGADAVRDGLKGLLLESNFHLSSPYLLTLAFDPVAGVADRFHSVVFAENSSGAVVGEVPEPSTLLLVACACWLSVPHLIRRSRPIHTAFTLKD